MMDLLGWTMLLVALLAVGAEFGLRAGGWVDGWSGVAMGVGGWVGWVGWVRWVR